jgi:putative ABC transport system substrate-binding protein
MKRRTFLLEGAGSTVGVMLLSSGCRIQAPWIQEQRTATVGYVAPNGTSPGAKPALARFRSSMPEYGWIEGTNLNLQVRFGDGDNQRLSDLARELVDLQVDVIVAIASNATRAVKALTSTIPIVGVSVPDPVSLGLVASLAHPGGNITGLASGTIASEGLIAKDVELLKSAVPALARLAVLVNLGSAAGRLQVAEVERAARALRIETLLLDIRSKSDLEPSFAHANAWQAQGVLADSDGGLVIGANAVTIAELALRQHLPAVAGVPIWAEAGYALTYGGDTVAPLGRAAYMVDRILRGAHPADIPVEEPNTLTLAANRTTLNALGITLPLEVAAQVTQWYE